MSDLSIPLSALERSTAPFVTQLPVTSYFDEDLFRREQELIFQHGPRYLGHALAVPEVGDYYALPQEGEGRALVRRAGGPHGVELISNICRHRQALMLRGRGNTRSHIVCPLHRWTYDLKGELVGAPHFKQDPCLHLNRYGVREWNGLLFEDNGRDIAADLAKLGPRGALDFSGYQLDRIQVHECDYNWKTFIEVYLEDYHVGPFHPGLGQFVTCEDLAWEFGRDYSVQTVGVNKALTKPGSAVYEKWHQQVLGFGNGQAPQQGAIWLTYYPNIMVECYPNVLVISTLFPRGPQKTTNIVEFYYPEEIVAFERDFVEAQQAAYMETCVEDDEIALRMDAGRKALMERGDNEVGPYQSPMEDGMKHFHEWYRGLMDRGPMKR
ncbi:aromatic ring-hydroxylating dioxygenase subunit alpha [Roseateles sp. SL47]|uniref:aromatic ring-hydroxylating oxygenase subunit alpha n=1 Tax=Roseateles sp. SL47 TaxID=2995138 RepID=UPI00226E6A74|nr:aromatic ring-hydroxylating dioxygenase subunit alpha [Roseateles sp. SL47]WAC72622.1 aromatic ring-hydroxylating dioxygenase subunit alpha [Roseateles sp. SL47]